ncbi:DnaT-like ssDNA-binding protein [Pseudovibrio sp. POLY-S9]|uniref:DnaT-like ssDNA-binding protein n=1 Tax=Pseudovibrio sp. POLY-S9 TaxID=1576596 RepID=UPI00070B4F34|nr:DnaT-like ssDNA-binding protein [Pseudovibrio sp. POLY-S9]
MSIYGTVEEADKYHAARGRADWAGLSEEQKHQTLISGAVYVDGEYVARINGQLSSYEQERAWPRVGATTCDGVAIPDDVTPQGWREASFEAAYLESKTPGILAPNEDRSVVLTEKTIGPMTKKFKAVSDGSSSGKYFGAIEQAVARFLQPETTATADDSAHYGGSAFWV